MPLKESALITWQRAGKPESLLAGENKGALLGEEQARWEGGSGPLMTDLGRTVVVLAIRCTASKL